MVHLQPAGRKKNGTTLDAAIWLGVHLALSEKEPPQSVFAIGELGLDGSLFAPRGALAIVDRALQELSADTQYIVPADLRKEPYTWKNTALSSVKFVSSLTQYLGGKSEKPEKTSVFSPQSSPVPLAVSAEMLRLFQLICAGGHSALLFGSPGEGKTHSQLLLQHLVVQDGNSQAATHMQYEYGAANSDLVLFLSHTETFAQLKRWSAFVAERFCFIDELPLWEKRKRELLHGWMEIGETPDMSRTTVVATANPCPCGWFGDARCTCTEYELGQYQKRLSGPLLDRFCFHHRVVNMVPKVLTAPELRVVQKTILLARKKTRAAP
ncbi:ATP-binding protein [Candidatus Woesebacteria bacterium]|nr:ATP-binding protein [Candidatus Woesebacteria bacterium]